MESRGAWAWRHKQEGVSLSGPIFNSALCTDIKVILYTYSISTRHKHRSHAQAYEPKQNLGSGRQIKHGTIEYVKIMLRFQLFSTLHFQPFLGEGGVDIVLENCLLCTVGNDKFENHWFILK